MKITLSQHLHLACPVEDQCGVVTFASFGRIVDTMINAGEILIRPGECVEGITISPKGLAFVIGKDVK